MPVETKILECTCDCPRKRTSKTLAVFRSATPRCPDCGEVIR